MIIPSYVPTWASHIPEIYYSQFFFIKERGRERWKEGEKGREEKRENYYSLFIDEKTNALVGKVSKPRT